MHEIVVNLHMHTRYSDGSGTHKDIAQAAIKAGLDAVIATDHNVLVRGVEGYYRSGPSRVLLLVGQEIHDQARIPQKNHLLVFNANRDVATLAHDVQHLVDTVREAQGLSFIAHPRDPAAPAFNEGDISWEVWHVSGYTGLELWNSMSEFKSHLRSFWHGLFYAYLPKFIGQGPHPEVLRKWDELLLDGKNTVAIGGSDAHAWPYSKGPLTRVLFPYYFHFQTINTHLFLPKALTGDKDTDKRMIYDAFAAGHCFIGHELPGTTKGFRFTAQGAEKKVIMGDEISAKSGVTLQVRTPDFADVSLLKNGQLLKTWKHVQTCAHITTEPGIYRVEVHKRYLGRKVGWIYSNPIYVR
ncbi:MAG: CehA/McbA family metallohydrolase [Anaerolineales bacterium]